ncbi:MAG: alpha/beta hydrolase [Hahellaceae bacterium]|jgi:acetyl esterase/lipase|nr:alpha/beta hydrolase [Hahellaceae bacterium]MCP5209885.1 alpha/beta hydrolase [Hahellaceae bacterium]
MSRVSVIKQMIRLGMKFVPNKLSVYRAVAKGGQLLVRPPKNFQVDTMTVNNVPVVWLNHKTHCSSRVILYLHGGGYSIGSNYTHLELAARIARAAKSQVVMAEYRLAPEHPYPAGLEDAFSVYQYLLNERIASNKIIIAGDSAGGGLSLALLQHIRDRGVSRPAGAVCLSPWLDLSCSMSSLSPTRSTDPLITPERIRFFARHYAGSSDRTQPGLSPFFGELNDLPPILIQVGSSEILLPECELFSRKANSRGSSVQLQVWPEMFHVWQFAARFLPEARHAINQIGMFVRQVSPV